VASVEYRPEFCAPRDAVDYHWLQFVVKYKIHIDGADALISTVSFVTIRVPEIRPVSRIVDE
jgi:hypothetical protein